MKMGLPDELPKQSKGLLKILKHYSFKTTRKIKINGQDVYVHLYDNKRSLPLDKRGDPDCIKIQAGYEPENYFKIYSNDRRDLIKPISSD